MELTPFQIEQLYPIARVVVLSLIPPVAIGLGGVFYKTILENLTYIK